MASIRFLPLLVVALSAPVAAAADASPRDQVLRLVPERMQFCVVLQDLRRHAADLRDSPFAASLQASPLGKGVREAPEVQKLTALEQQFRTFLGVGVEQLRDDVVGDAVVLAYRGGPPERPNDEQGVAFTWARDPKLVAGLLDRLNAHQRGTGELKDLRARVHAGAEYVQRVKAKDADEFYYVRGNVIAFSSQEAMIRAVIDRDRAAPPAGEVKPALAKEFEALGVDRCLLVAWMDPRSFDPELTAKSEAAAGAEQAFLKNFLAYWRALESVALFVAVERDFEMGLAVRLRKDAVPASAREFLASARRRSEVWAAVPDDALVAVAGRVDGLALARVVEEFLTPEARQAVRAGLEASIVPALGRELWPDVAASLGPDWGAWAVAPSASEGPIPRLTAALRIRPGPKAEAVSRAILNALHTLSLLFRLDYNAKHADQVTLEEMRADGVEVKYLVNDKGFPPGVRPAYAVKGGYLVVSGSPDAIRAVAPPAAAAEVAGEVPYLRISFRHWRAYLKTHRDAIAMMVAGKGGQKPEAVADQIDKVVSGLEGVDRLEMAHEQVSEDAVHLRLRVRLEKPLRKGD
jgi:hypothetical protein